MNVILMFIESGIHEASPTCLSRNSKKRDGQTTPSVDEMRKHLLRHKT